MIRFLILIFIISTLKTVGAINPIVFDGSKDILNIGSKISIYEDPTNNLKIDQILKLDSFVQSDQKIPNLGISSSSFWIEINILNSSNEKNIVLELANPMLNEIDLYKINPDNTYTVRKYGDIFPYSSRDFDHQNFLINLQVLPKKTEKYLLRIRSWEQISLSISLGKQKSILESTLIQDLIFGIYFGIIISLALYNIFIYITVKDRSYLYYVIYIVFVALTQGALQGYPFRFLSPNMPDFSNHALIIFASITGIAIIEFMKLFLKTKEYTPYLHKGTIVITLIYVIAGGSKLIGFNNLSFQLTDIAGILISLYALIVAIRISNKGYRPAKYFLFAWSIFLVGIIFFVLRNEGLLPSNNFTNYTMPIGSGLEVILLSFALADKINIYRKEKEEAQEETLISLKENERIIREQNIVLEQKVKERTTELNQTVSDLKDAQAQLVDAEKMSSLGQLTAGIAHEINNPINFVSSNIPPLRQDIEDLNTILSKYEEIEASANLDEKLNEINLLKKELDYDYLKTELKTIINGIEDGAKRTAEIVSGLKNFSRLDEVDLQKTDINEGINSTLVLVKNKLNNIQITKELATLPLIECYPSKLNQLFMNIMDNAIQAIHAKSTTEENEISITTYTENNNVVLTVKDTGIGMSQEVKEKIFEPFYTTKPVGEGTGLGMSIAYSIINIHNATIEINSKENIGTKIIIKIPFNNG